jgi:hypothetical protein
MVEDQDEPQRHQGHWMLGGLDHMEYRHGTTLERLREHLIRADGELEATQRFLGPGTPDEDEVALVRVVADARRTLVGDALETARWRLEGGERG